MPVNGTLKHKEDNMISAAQTMKSMIEQLAEYATIDFLKTEVETWNAIVEVNDTRYEARTEVENCEDRINWLKATIKNCEDRIDRFKTKGLGNKESLREASTMLNWWMGTLMNLLASQLDTFPKKKEHK